MQEKGIIVKRILSLLMATTVVFGCCDFTVEAADSDPYYHSGISASSNVDLLITETNETNYFSLKKGSGLFKVINRLNETVADKFIIPGLKWTNVLGDTCKDMVPEGMCYHDGYFFITAYCFDEEHNSVIHVVNANTGEFVTTLVLDQKIHAGGITYYKTNLWISDTKEGQGKLYYYDYNEVKSRINVAKHDKTIRSVNIGSCTNGYVNLPKNRKGSFVTTDGTYLCVGQHMDSTLNAEEGKGKLDYYSTVNKPKSGITLTLHDSKKIDDDAQGVCFYKTYSNVEYMIVSTSKGRRYRSIANIYRLVNGGEYIKIREIEMPSMMQGVTMYNGKTYFLFNSGAKVYRNECTVCENDCDCPNRYITRMVYGFTNAYIYK